MRVNTAANTIEEVLNSDEHRIGGGPFVAAGDGDLYMNNGTGVLLVDPDTGTGRLVCAYSPPTTGTIQSLTGAADGRLVAVLSSGTTRILRLGLCTPSTGVIEIRGFPPGIGRLTAPLAGSAGWLYGVTLDVAPESVSVPMFNVPQTGGALVRLSLDAPPPAVDSDGDGLPNAWETTYGLDPFRAGGAAGAAGDPDGDGRTNAQELADGTHPSGVLTRYFAEGATGPFFRTRLDLANPGGGARRDVLLRFLTDTGARIAHDGRRRRRARTLSIDPATLPGLAHADVLDGGRVRRRRSSSTAR